MILKSCRADAFRLNSPRRFICLPFDGLEITEICAVIIVIAEDWNASCGRLTEDQVRASRKHNCPSKIVRKYLLYSALRLHGYGYRRKILKTLEKYRLTFPAFLLNSRLSLVAGSFCSLQRRVKCLKYVPGDKKLMSPNSRREKCEKHSSNQIQTKHNSLDACFHTWNLLKQKGSN